VLKCECEEGARGSNVNVKRVQWVQIEMWKVGRELKSWTPVRHGD